MPDNRLVDALAKLNAPALDAKMTPAQTIVPVTVTVTGGASNGSPIPTNTVFQTPDHQPNIIIKVVMPFMMILSRGTKAFMVSLLAILPVAGATGIIPFSSFWNLVLKAASLSVGVGFVAAGNAFVEVLTKLDQKFPTWTA